MPDYFVFNNFDSRNYGIYIHDGSSNGRERFLAPAKATVTDRPIGSSGSMLFDQYYAEKVIKLETYVENNQMSEDNLRDVSTYLAQLGEQRLTLSYEGHKYYTCILEDQINMTEYPNQGGIFSTLNFKTINPFGFSVFTTSEINSGLYYDAGWYYDAGLLYAEDMGKYSFANLTNNQVLPIYNGSNCNHAIPTFKFTGQATTLKIEHFVNSALTDKWGELTYGAFNGTLDISGSLVSCFKNGVIDNTTLGGGFTFLKGITTPNFVRTGNILNVSGNTITLPPSASSVNDFYNGNPIYMLNKSTGKMERRVIVDYVGSTRLVILDYPFTNIAIGDEYNIYNQFDGKNYFRISGTGFVNLGLTVDFRYVYL